MPKERSAFDQKKLDELQAKADAGSMTAMQILQKEKRMDTLESKKEEMMAKAMFERPEGTKDEVLKEMPVMPTDRSIPHIVDELELGEIENYIEKGQFKSLPAHMAVYLKWMEEAHDWYYKFKSRNWVMRYLIANCKDEDGNNISYYMAEKIFNDMMVFFYPDKNFRKNSWLRYLAERLEMGAALALEDNDFETYGKNIERAAKIINSIVIDKSDVDPRLLDRRPRFFVTDAKQLGLPEVDRYELARQIDGMGISENEKKRVKQDLGVEEREI